MTIAEPRRCPQCDTALLRLDSCANCGWGAHEPKHAGKCACGGKVVWRNDTFALCVKCYDEHIYPRLPATRAEIEFHKRLRSVNEWIAKHPEFKTKREACLHMLKARGLTGMLPRNVK